MNELKTLLKNINVERDVQKKRDVIKKVIAYMTLGIDVSRLFTDMIMAIETKDMVVKKMIYLYLSNYAHKEPQMALMCINTLTRDCENEDPMVRGLALRSLSSLRMESMLEYIEQPMKKAFTDISPYVRKTGVMAVLKVYGLDKDLIVTGNYIEKVKDMLHDVDASVVTNALMVLDEIDIRNGGIEVTSELIMGLLNRMGEFSEWGLGLLLDLVSRYFPQSEDETFAIMNVLDPLLRHSSSSAVLATVKCFVHLTEPYPDMLGQVISRAKPPMLTLITGGSPEIQFALLKHLEVLLPRKVAKGIFADEYRSFFVRYNEPPHVKHLKVGLLPMITNEDNVREIASELCEYVCDVDAELSKRAIDALGEITIRNESVASDLTIRIIEFIDLDMAYVRSESLKVLGNILRVFPELRQHLLPNLSRYIRTIDDPEARGVIVWLLGEFGEEITEAPYSLESVLDGFGQEVNVNLKLQILTAAMKLFYKRPPEMQAMLGRLLACAVNDSSNQDVHDKAILYYRLLTTDVVASKQIFDRASTASLRQRIVDGGNFAEESNEELLDQLFTEFNTLAVIYKKPSKTFIGDDFLLVLKDVEEKRQRRNTDLNAQQASVVTAVDHGLNDLKVSDSSASNQEVNLLDWGDDITSSQPAPSTSVSDTPSLSLDSNFTLSPADFQQYWGSFAEVPLPNGGNVCSLAALPDELAEVEQGMAEVNVCTMASGPLGNPSTGMKFFFYAKTPEDVLLGKGNDLFLIQLQLQSSSGDIHVTVKASNPENELASRLVATLKQGLRSFSPT